MSSIPLDLHFLRSLFVQCHRVRSNSLREQVPFSPALARFSSPLELFPDRRAAIARMYVFICEAKLIACLPCRCSIFLRESSSLLVDLSRFEPIFSKRYPNLIKTDIATPILKQARWRVLRSTWIFKIYCNSVYLAYTILVVNTHRIISHQIMSYIII